MSHEIRETDKQQARQMAWHGLTEVKPDLTIANCWLGTWDYVPKAISIDGKKTPFAMLGVSDNAQVDLLDAAGNATGEKSPLIVGDSFNPDTFKPVLNAKLLAILDKALNETGLTLESNGTVMNRGRTFMSFSFPKGEGKFNAAGRDFESFLNIGNGNDQSSPLWVNTSNICTVCNNTFTMNMGNAGKIMEVKKTKFSDLAIQGLGKAIDAMLKGQKEFAKLLGELVQIPADEMIAREFFAGFLSEPEKPLSVRSMNTIDTLVGLFKTGKGNDGNDMSDVFSALTDYYTHQSASSQNTNDAKWKNFVSSEFGSGMRSKSQAWVMLTDTKQRKGIVTLGKRALKLTAEAIKNAEAAKANPVEQSA